MLFILFMVLEVVKVVFRFAFNSISIIGQIKKTNSINDSKI
jgi:hypothetical protein